MKKFLAIVGIVILIGLVGFGAYSLSRPQTTTPTTNSAQSSPDATTPSSPAPSASSGSTTVSKAELAKNNGKNGAKCWVAVSGTVYDVSNNREWVNGEHVPSNGAAKCGLDETSAISQSPHGSSVLSGLPVVGSLQ